MYNPLLTKRVGSAGITMLLVILLTACQLIQPPAADAPTNDSVERYRDPQGFFTIPIPTNWTATAGAGFVLLHDPEEQLKVYALTLPAPTGDLAAAIAAGWVQVAPTFALTPTERREPPATDGTEKRMVILYETPADRVAFARATLYQGHAYLLLLDGALESWQKRAAQIDILVTGLEILALGKTDLTNSAPLPVDDQVKATLAQFITHWQQQFQIPGVAVAIVQNGAVVYRQTFGVRNPAGEPLTPDSYMMIGSTGKSLTTLLMATLIDEGRFTWDTPVAALYPAFAVKDPALSQTITMRNLVCACTGVPRRDWEFAFNANTLSAEEAVASLRDFEFYTGFGEAFQYSNQMVAAAGYIAALTDPQAEGDLLTNYATVLQRRLLAPLAMMRTTVAFDTVLADNNYATPYAYNYQNRYIPIAPTLEKVLAPVTPAGAHWSTLDDMTTYLLLQLAGGVTADGQRLVSTANLAEVRKGQIQVTDQMHYGLGWGISDYKGQPLIEHSGNTLGFTSEFKFLPSAQLGIVVLTNAQGTNPFSAAVSERLLELVFQQAPAIESRLAFYHQQIVEEGVTVQKRVIETLDLAAITPYLGTYQSETLGDLQLTLQDGQLRADVGEFASPLLPAQDDKGAFAGYMFADPPLTGLILTLTKDEHGRPLLTMGEGVDQYRFIGDK